MKRFCIKSSPIDLIYLNGGEGSDVIYASSATYQALGGEGRGYSSGFSTKTIEDKKTIDKTIGDRPRFYDISQCDQLT